MNSYPLQVQADGAGNASVSLPDRAAGVRWKITFISLQTTSVAQSQAGVYVNNQFLIGTSKGNFDSASGEPSIVITSKDHLTVQWADCDPNAVCSAVLWYEDANAVH